MARRKIWLSIVAVGWLAVPLAGFAAAPAAPAAKDALPLPDAYVEMAKVCGLLTDQIAKMAVKIQLKDQAIAQWNRENGPRIANYRTILSSARARQDREAEAKARNELHALEKSKADLIAKTDADIAAVMTAQQRATWDGYRLWQQLLEHFKQFTFTEKQSKAIRRIADGAAGQPIRTRGDPEAAEKARKDRFDKCVAIVIDKVLTPEQYEAVTGRPAPPRAKEEEPPRRRDERNSRDDDESNPRGRDRRGGR